MIQNLAYAPPRISVVLLLVLSLFSGAFGHWGGYQEKYGPYSGWMFLVAGFVVALLFVVLMGKVAARRQGVDYQ